MCEEVFRLLISPLGNGAQATLLVLISVGAAVYAGSQAGLWRVPLLERPAQVPEGWRRELGIDVGMFAYGVMLGGALFTFIVSPLVYVWLGLALVSASPTTGALIGATYGVSRIVPIAAGVARLMLSRGEQADALRWSLAGFPHQAISSGALAGAALVIPFTLY